MKVDELHLQISKRLFHQRCFLYFPTMAKGIYNRALAKAVLMVFYRVNHCTTDSRCLCHRSIWVINKHTDDCGSAS